MTFHNASASILFATRRVGAALACIALSSSVTSGGAAPKRDVSARNLTHGFVSSAVAAETLSPAERSFLNKAIETSRQQTRLAEIGVSQATSTDVRSHALQLVTDYRSLTDALEALVRRRGGIAGAPVGGTSETYRKLLEKSGATFDREFLKTTAQINRDTLGLFEQFTSESKDPDVRELTAAQLPMLRAHRTTITELQKTME